MINLTENLRAAHEPTMATLPALRWRVEPRDRFTIMANVVGHDLAQAHAMAIDIIRDKVATLPTINGQPNVAIYRFEHLEVATEVIRDADMKVVRALAGEVSGYLFADICVGGVLA